MAALTKEQEAIKDQSCRELAALIVSLPHRYPEIWKRIQEAKQRRQLSAPGRVMQELQFAALLFILTAVTAVAMAGG